MRIREILEDREQTIGLIFGRFNPPHKGHKNAWKMAATNDEWFIGTNQSTVGPKDPLPAQIKVAAMETIMPEAKGHIVFSQSWLTLASELYQKFPNATLKLYTDEEWVSKTINQYNGAEGPHGTYNFKNIEWVKTPRLASATDLRAAVLNNDPEAFAKAAGVPSDTIVDVNGREIEFFDLVAEYLGQYKKEDTNLREFDVRTSKKYQKTETYKGYEIYVSVDTVLKGQHMAVAYDRAGKEAFRGKGRVPEQAANMIKDTIDGRQNTASKVQGNATIDFNAQFSREILEPGMDKIFAKIVAGPKLVVANSQYYDDPDALAQMGFKPTAFRTKEGLLAMGMTAKQTQGAELISNGRYYVGNQSYDEFENAVYELDFHSVVNDKNEKYSLGKPGLTVATRRT
jgi:nicotinamide mononucleotide adenylyltransferase